MMELSMPGLVNMGCSHDRQEFVGCADGEETWRCLIAGCGETILRYIDCGSGG